MPAAAVARVTSRVAGAVDLVVAGLVAEDSAVVVVVVLAAGSAAVAALAAAAPVVVGKVRSTRLLW